MQSDISQGYFDKDSKLFLSKELSGVTELAFKILPFFKLKYSKNVILVSLDAQ